MFYMERQPKMLHSVFTPTLFLVFIVTISDKNKKGKCKQQFDVVSTKMFLFPLIIISQWTLNIEYSAARLGKVIA
jgi:hypothetical protein